MESVQRIGCVLHVSSSGNMILKSEILPRIGYQAIDQKRKRIGRILDVFGSVSHPYVSVKPDVEEPSSFVGQKLYAVPQSVHVCKLRKGKKQR